MSLRARDGTMIETILRVEEAETRLVSFRDGQIDEHRTVSIDGRRLIPYSPTNNLLTHRVVLLPSAVTEYEFEGRLLDDVQRFIHRYVDIDLAFEEIAAHYILMTWGYDTFNEVPYLRVRGDYGSGKSRFLLTVGSLCFKPIFASGASTVSPLFRLIDQIGGTLVIDEADFWASDERAEIIKILNGGNAKGFPVLRSEVSQSKEFSPRAFNVFGPKLVATRNAFEDEALESRCLTQVLGERALRRDIPISLPRSFEAEAEQLRNRLLMYRFRRFSTLDDQPLEAEPGLPPRTAQILAPLLTIAKNAEARSRLCAFVKGGVTARQSTKRNAEQQVLHSLKRLMANPSAMLTLSALARAFDQDWGVEYGVQVSPRWIGSVLRGLGVQPQKSNGVYVIHTSAYPRLRELFVQCFGDFGDFGDVES